MIFFKKNNNYIIFISQEAKSRRTQDFQVISNRAGRKIKKTLAYIHVFVQPVNDACSLSVQFAVHNIMCTQISFLLRFIIVATIIIFFFRTY